MSGGAWDDMLRREAENGIRRQPEPSGGADDPVLQDVDPLIESGDDAGLGVDDLQQCRCCRPDWVAIGQAILDAVAEFKKQRSALAGPAGGGVEDISHAPSVEDSPVPISSQAGLAALRAGARRAGLEYGQVCTCVDHLPPAGMPFPSCPIHWPTDREIRAGDAGS